MSKNKKKDAGKGFNTLNTVLIVQLIVMLGLSLFITKTISMKTHENAVQHMGAITDERANIIESYIENAEGTLRAFSKASQVKDLLEYGKVYDYHDLVDKELKKDVADPKAAELQAAAQDYTVEFGKSIDNLEGVWIGTWETLVLTQTNPDVVGITTRKDPEKLKQLQDAMLNGEGGLYDAGIIISPASGKQCISMYIAVYDDYDKPIGLVGLGIYTSGLVDTLDKIPVRGIEHSFYSMVNVENNKYIFNKDAMNIDIEATNPEIVKLCADLSGSSESKTGEFEYKDGKTKYISSYAYIPKHGWIIMIDDETSEVFALTTTMRIYLGIFAVVIIGLIVVFNLITRRQQMINQKLVSTIAKNKMTKKSLDTAMFKDVLTGVNNRISFSVNSEKASEAAGKHFFAMFNISDFSSINSQFGNDSGDQMLVRTVDNLKETFGEDNVYRTGSDEFVVMVKGEGEFWDADAMLDKVNTVLRQLLVPMDTESYGTIYPKYKVAVVKKSGTLDTSVITALKDMTNQTGEATYGMIDYKSLN